MSQWLRTCACMLLVAACSPRADDGPEVEVVETGAPWVDVTADSGVVFVHDNGATADRLLPETMGSGVAVFDYDGDGRPDLFFVNGSPRSPAALYRNLGDWRFEDVTARAGAAVQILGMGVATGDIDRDGDIDLFVSGVGSDVLLRNRGDGTFTDASSSIADLPPGFSSSAAFLDADGDGWLDLYVGRYVTWSSESDLPCMPDGRSRSYCTPEIYPGSASRLLRNLGPDGGFADITDTSGLADFHGKTLGVVPLDFNDDGLIDLAVANDTERNFLFVNRGDGTFNEQGVELGIAFSESGAPRGGMGIDAGDLSGNGCPDIVVGNFAQEMSAVFHCGPEGVYTDDAAYVGVGLPTLLTLAFGTLIADFDLDGWNDIVVANGHIEPEITTSRPNQSYPQPMQAFRHVGAELRFAAVEAPALTAARVGRGLAGGDLDGDGDLDLVVTQNGGPAALLRNDGSRGHGLGLTLWSVQPVNAAYDAKAQIVSGEHRQSASLVSGRSYLSASQPLLLFGLDGADSIDFAEIAWPGGRRLQLQGLAGNLSYSLIGPGTSSSPPTTSE